MEEFKLLTTVRFSDTDIHKQCRTLLREIGPCHGSLAIARLMDRTDGTHCLAVFHVASILHTHLVQMIRIQEHDIRVLGFSKGQAAYHWKQLLLEADSYWNDDYWL